VWVRGRFHSLASAGLCSLVIACSVARPVRVTTDAPSLRGYLAEHRPANLRVTARTGRRFWIHAPKVRGDSLIGRQGYDMPVRELGVGLEDVAELHTGHFSAGRTGAAVGGGLVAAGVVLLLMIDNVQPVY
jgi:hypothetical protein